MKGNSQTKKMASHTIKSIPVWAGFTAGVFFGAAAATGAVALSLNEQDGQNLSGKTYWQVKQERGAVASCAHQQFVVPQVSESRLDPYYVLNHPPAGFEQKAFVSK